MKKKKKKLLKEQILCVSAGVLLGLMAAMTGKSSFLQEGVEGVYIDRPGYGEEEASYEVQVKSGTEEEVIQIPVRGRTYTEEEATAVFEQMMDEVMATMLAGNASQMEIRTDLSFPEQIEGYPAVELSWSSSSGGIIRSDGAVDNENLKEKIEATLFLTMTAGPRESSMEIPLVIYPAPERINDRSRKERLEDFLAEEDAKTSNRERFLLPAEYDGVPLQYSAKKDNTWILFPFLGIAAAVLLGLRPKEEEKKRKKERETELLVDYSEIISKLIVYIGAGLTVRNAWHQLAENYIKAGGRKRAVYEEILAADRELANGETESAAYMRFARRCRLKCYLRMVSLLEQNRKTGDSALLAALETEMEEAFEQRKNVARRLGEEAGTKLMAPLIISLLTVMVIVMVPAVFKMG